MFTFTITYNGIVREIVPYNYDTFKLTYSPYNENIGYFNLIKAEEIEVVGEDYNYLNNLLRNNKCAIFELNIYCQSELKFKGIFNYYTVEYDYDACLMTIKTQWDSKYTDVLSILQQKRNLASYYEPVFCLGLNITYTKSVKVATAINALLTGTGLTLESEFLTSLYTPMPHALPNWFENAFSATQNRYNNLFLSQSTNNLEDLIVSLEYVLNSLHTCNLRWKIDEANNKLIVEHLKYFENGESYINPAQIGLDLTILDNGKYLDDTNNYKILMENAPKYDEFWSTNDYFINGLYYVCAINIKSNKVQFNVDIDPQGVLDWQVKTTLLLGTLLSAGNNIVYEFQPTQSQLEEYNIFLQRDFRYYFLWGAKMKLIYDTESVLSPFPQIDCYSTIKNRKQSDVVFPLCCGTLNETKTIKTDLGEGYIDEYTLNTNGFVNVTLKYEDND